MLKFLRLIFVIILLGCISLQAQLPKGFITSPVGEPQNPLTGITFDDMGRLYAWDKTGRVWIQDKNENLHLILDLSEEIAAYNDHGLLGLALHPNFLENGWIYLLYTVDPYFLHHAGTPAYQPQTNWNNRATIGRISRYTLDLSSDIPVVKDESRKILLGEKMDDGFPILHLSHGVGSLLFGQDGSLLASCGDGASFEGMDNGEVTSGSFSEDALQHGIITPQENVGAFRAQMINSLNGKILRIDPETGEGVPGNPFYIEEAPQAPQSKVWAMGLRNPFRFSLVPFSGSHVLQDGDPGTLLVGDVGWAYWEEINLVDKPGQNMGWPIYEGMETNWQYNRYSAPTLNLDAPNPLGEACKQPFFDFHDLLKPPRESDLPIFENPCDTRQLIPEEIPTHIHRPPIISWTNQDWNPEVQGTHIPIFDEQGNATAIFMDDPTNTIKGETFTGTCSIGGVFYTGQSFPASYQMTYLHGDYAGWIRQFIFDPEMNLVEVKPFADTTTHIVSMAVHPLDGSLYYVRFDENGSQIYQIVYGGNTRPTAVFTVDQQYGKSPLEVKFKGSKSFDPDGESLSYFWDFGDGTTSNQTDPTHVYSHSSNLPHAYTASLTVTDQQGAQHVIDKVISLNNTPPIVSIDSLPAYYGTTASYNIELLASVTDQEHAQESLRYEWQTFLHHNTHYHAEPVDTLPKTYMHILPVGCGEETYYYRIALAVTDEHGLTGTDERIMNPDCGPPTVIFKQQEADYQQHNVTLSWQTLEENKISHFEILRATSKDEFDVLGKVSPLINKAYKFSDNNPRLGTNIYMIRAFNIYHSYVDSDTVFVETFLDKPQIRFYPQPVADRLHIQGFKLDKVYQLFLYDFQGKEIYEEKGNWDTFQQLTLDVTPFSSGMYTYKVISGDIQLRGKWLKK